MNEKILEMIKALADKNRLYIFELIVKQRMCATEILEKVDISQPTLSHHMKVLVSSGLVNIEKDAQWVKYSVNEENLQALSDYLTPAKH